MRKHALNSLAWAYALAIACSLGSATRAAGEPVCGDVDGSGALVATDALLVLQTAVELSSVPDLVCPADRCGDGVMDPDEECDQADLGDATCEGQGLYGTGLACKAGCLLDTDRCSPTRFVDNGDGTVTDQQTGLQWEKKSEDGGLHDKSNTYTWSAAGDRPDGTSFIEFLADLNGCVESGGFPPTGLAGGFAGHCDWRLPSVVELLTIVDTSVTDCGNGGSCIDPIFGPTINYNYWTATSFGDNVSFAWFVDFDVGQPEEAQKIGDFHVRAVRSTR